jgi:hypothetical protein
MSVSVYVTNLFGWKVKVEDEIRYKKRFNEKTGEPYELEVVTGKRIVSLGDEVLFVDEVCSHEVFDGLMTIALGYDSGEWFLGVVVQKTENLMYGEGHFFEVGDESIGEDHLNAVKKFAEKYDIDVPPVSIVLGYTC